MYTAIRKSLNKENDKGFTLIELLVVIIIIGILAAIAIPIFLNQRKKAFEAGQKSDARTIATQMETFFTDAQTYPAAGGVTQAGQVLTWTVGGDTVRLSPNNDASILSSGDGFCITVTNTPNDAVMVYNSKLGGLQPKGATCAALDFPTVVLAA